MEGVLKLMEMKLIFPGSIQFSVLAESKEQ